MRVTAIKAQARNTERVSIYVDDKYAFSLTPSQLLEYRLHTGKEIDEAGLNELKKASDYGKLLERVMNFIMIRPRSLKETRQYLWRKKADPESIDEIITKLEDRGYLNDSNFASSWSRDRQSIKPVSKRRLEAELRDKGVANNVIQQTINDSEYDEAQALREIIAKKRRQSRYQDDQKLMQYLARQGFGYELIKSTLSEVDNMS